MRADRWWLWDVWASREQQLHHQSPDHQSLADRCVGRLGRAAFSAAAAAVPGSVSYSRRAAPLAAMCYVFITQ